jgi:hypothetical protein
MESMNLKDLVGNVTPMETLTHGEFGSINLQFIINKFTEIITYMDTNEIKALKQTNKPQYRGHMMDKYEDFYEKYPHFFEKAIEGENLGELFKMFRIIDAIQGNKIPPVFGNLIMRQYFAHKNLNEPFKSKELEELTKTHDRLKFQLSQKQQNNVVELKKSLGI